MAYATDTKPGDGSTVAFTVSFDFIQRSHVQVYRVVTATKAQIKLTVIASGAPTGDEYVWSADDQITVGTAPTTSEQLEIIRETPETFRIIQWNDGSYIVADDLNTSDTQWLYLIQENTDRIDTLEGVTGGATGAITEAEATADPTSPAWSGDLNLASAGAIERVYSTIVGDGTSYPGTGNLGKDGKIRIKTSSSVPELYYWSAKTKTWVQIGTKGDAGPQGQKGDAATADAGTTITLAEGSSATVVNSGTISAAVFDFGIPKGGKGDKGDKGDSGASTQSDWNEADSSKAEFINNKPTIPAAQINSDWAQTDATKLDFIENKPSIPPLQEQSDWNQGDSGAVDFIKNKPSISGAQVNSDWAETDATKKSFIQNKPTVTVNGDDDITNVRVDLNYTKAADQGTVTNTKGDDAVIPVADGANAGLLSAADKTKLDGLSGALVYKGQIDLTSATVPSLAAGDAGFTYMNSTNGSCSSEWAGKTSGLTAGDAVTQNDMVTWDGTQFIFQKNTGGNGKTDLGWTSASTQGTVTSSTGANATVPKVDTNNAGLMLPGDFDKLGGIQADAQKNVKSNWNASSGDAEILNKPVIAQSDWAQTTSSDPAFIKNKPTITMDGGNVDNISVNLTYTASATNGIVNSDKGTNATLPLVVTNGNAGLMTGTDKNKLDGIAGGAQVNVGTDLSNTTNATQVTVQSSTGDNTTLDQANGTNAGVMSAAMYTKLNGLTPGGDDNVQSDWDVTDAASDAFIQNKPTIPVVPTVGNGSLTVQTAGEGASSTGTFTANQTGNSTLELPTIRYQDISGTPTIPAPITPGNGQINVNAGNGLSASGTNATANQGTDTTRTLTVVAKNNTISVASDGVSVNTANLGIPAAANNGQINVDVGDGLSASGSNATANQSGDTTRTLSLDQPFVQKMIDDSSSGGGGTTINYNGASAWGNVAANGTLPGSSNISLINRLGVGYFEAVFATPMPNANYSVVGTPDSPAQGSVYTFTVVDKTATSFSWTLRQDTGSTNPYADIDCSFAVFSSNALPPKGGTGTDAWAAVKRTTSNGPCVIESSFNIASVTRTGAGTYDYVFTTAMPNANYAVQVSCFNESNAPDYLGIGSVYSKTATGFTLDVRAYTTNALEDRAVSVAVNATNATLPQTVTQEQIDAAINNPGVSAWGDVDKDGNLLQGNNIASVVRDSKSVYDVTFATPMPNANYAVVITANAGEKIASGSNRNSVANTKTANGFRCTIKANSSYEDTPFSFVVAATNALPPKGGTGTDAWAAVQSDGTVTASFNGSVSKLSGSGEYQFTFTTPMPTADYAVQLTVNNDSNGYGALGYAHTQTTSGFSIAFRNPSGSYFDRAFGVAVNATNATLPTTFTETQIQGVIDAKPEGIAKAWINFDGTNSTERDSFNVAALTDAGTGAWQITFTNNLSTSNYVVLGTSGDQGDTWAQRNPQYIPQCSNLQGTGFKVHNASTIGGVSGGYDYMGFVVFAK